MATQQAIALKKMFSESSEEEFEPMTFGELKVGERFICMPVPGDNHGHGGFRGVHWIFIKINEEKAQNLSTRDFTDITTTLHIIQVK